MLILVQNKLLLAMVLLAAISRPYCTWSTKSAQLSSWAGGPLAGHCTSPPLGTESWDMFIYSCTLQGSRQPQQNRTLGPRQDALSTQALIPPPNSVTSQPTGSWTSGAANPTPTPARAMIFKNTFKENRKGPTLVYWIYSFP